MNKKDDVPLTTNEITEHIIGSAFAVANTLGSGFLEKVYENALTHELRKARLTAEQQAPVRVFYDSVPVGDFFRRHTGGEAGNR